MSPLLPVKGGAIVLVNAAAPTAISDAVKTISHGEVVVDWFVLARLTVLDPCIDGRTHATPIVHPVEGLEHSFLARMLVVVMVLRQGLSYRRLSPQDLAETTMRFSKQHTI